MLATAVLVAQAARATKERAVSWRHAWSAVASVARGFTSAAGDRAVRAEVPERVPAAALAAWRAARPRAVRINTVARRALALAGLSLAIRAARTCPRLATACPAAPASVGLRLPFARPAPTKFSAVAGEARRELVTLGGQMDRLSLSPCLMVCVNRAVLLAVGLTVVGCGGTTASSSATGGTHSGGSASNGGASSGGASSGGASNGGASNGGAGATAPVPCFGGGGGLVPAGKSCETDADCEALPTAGCCGPSVIVGIAVSARAYEACYPYPTGCPPGLGCASFSSTEDGTQAGLAPASFKVSCAAVDGGAKSCRTVSQDSSEGTLWSCRCSTGASCCQPAGGAGSP